MNVIKQIWSAEHRAGFEILMDTSLELIFRHGKLLALLNNSSEVSFILSISLIDFAATEKKRILILLGESSAS